MTPWLLATIGALLATIAWLLVASRRQGRRLGAAGAELAQARRAHEPTERLARLGTLVASVMHEVNNPNHAILLNAPVLRTAWRDAASALAAHAGALGDLRLGGVPFAEMAPDVTQMIEEIERSALRIRDVVAAIRAYAHPQSAAAPSAFDFGAAVRDVVATAAPALEERGVRLHVDLPRRPLGVVGDRLQIGQCLAQLLHRAADASTAPDPTIEVRVSVEASAEAVVLEVCHEGRPTALDRLPDLRRPFADLGSAGDGDLGLAMVVWVVQRHDGTLSILPRPDRGSCLRITLPMLTR